MLSGEAGREDMPMCEDANGGAERDQQLRIAARHAGRAFLR